MGAHGRELVEGAAVVVHLVAAVAQAAGVDGPAGVTGGGAGVDEDELGRGLGDQAAGGVFERGEVVTEVGHSA
jgi:hypothetical protein